MSCTSADDFPLIPVAYLGGDDFNNVCTVANITANSAATSLLTSCCGSSSINVVADGCYSYCNVTGSSAQSTWNSCFSAGSASNGLDYQCNNADDTISATGVVVTASAGSTYLGGSSGTVVFPVTSSTSAPASGSATATTTTTGASATGSASASGKSAASTAKSSASATGSSSAAKASSTAASGGPTVKQFSKGAIAVLALAFVGLLA